MNTLNCGNIGCSDYIIKEVQKVYRLQGVDIDDKHIEIIINQMLQKVNVTDVEILYLLAGTMVNRRSVENENAKMRAEGKREAQYRHILLGITQQVQLRIRFFRCINPETTRVLTDASIKAKKDDLIGLKENIIIGKLIPAGTGIKQYVDVKVKPAGQEEKNEVEESVKTD